VSGGRLTLGLGAGGTGFDATVLGNAPLSPAARVARFAEFVAVVDRALREPAFSHRGEHYTVDDARMVPGCVQQPRLPLALAAAGATSLGLVARYADAWITYGDAAYADRTAEGTERIVRAQIARLEAACAEIGRDPATIDRIYLIGNTDEKPLASVDSFRAFCDRYRALGFTDVVFHHPRAGDPVWDEPEAIVEQIAAARVG
jgi:alkanesulfonate monooxygenase SsuD/methylene tetrahydromethanopterin reductase-like flavin-dependent oxidoreductase (luciferase family)